MRYKTKSKTAIDWVLLIIAWSTTTQLYAQQVTFGGDLESIPLKSFVYVGILAFLGGLSATLQKFANPEIVVDRVFLEISKDLVLSISAGTLAFFLTEQAHTPVMLEAAVITVAGRTGSRWLDRAANSFLDRFFPQTSQKDKS